jgi:Putative beta-barrel porin 2
MCSSLKLYSVVLAVLFFSYGFVPVASAKTYREEGIRIGGNEFKEVKGIRMGKARVKGGFSTQGQFDSNVYLTPKKATKDYVFTLSPKVLMDLPFGIDERHLFQAMYMGEGGLFCSQTEQNYMNQRGAANLNLHLPFGFLNANDDFRDTTDRSGTEFTTRVRRLENTAAATMGVKHNKLSYEVNYTNFYKSYFKQQYKNLGYFENDFKGTVFYQLFPKTQALIDYTFGLLDYYKDRSRDGYLNQVTTGLKGELTAKTQGIVKAGFQARDYDVGKGYVGFVGELGSITKFSERTEVSLKYHTTPIESVADSGNYYISNIISAQWDQKLMGHFSAMLRSSIAFDHYPQINEGDDIKRQDWLFDEGIWLYYSIKHWGKIGIGYDFRRRSSNIGTQSYTDNLVSTRFDLVF